MEDDQRLQQHISASLQQHGFAVTPVADAHELEEIFFSPVTFQVVILDRLLGAVDTKDLVPRLKTHCPHVPIVILSAISTPSERTDLLNLGADDYLGKPFSMQELIARIRVVQRRSGRAPANFLQLGNTVLDAMKRVISVGENSVSLPTKEFLLLKALSEQPGRVWSRMDLLDSIWGVNPSAETNVVEATITNLRRRLTDLNSNLRIRNMRNAGYWIEE